MVISAPFLKKLRTSRALRDTIGCQFGILGGHFGRHEDDFDDHLDHSGALGTPLGSLQGVQHGPDHGLASHSGAARWKKWYPWAYKGGQSVVNNGVLSMFTK